MTKMIITRHLFLPLLFLSQLAAHSAQESTQDQKCQHFTCGQLGPIGYPFFRIDRPKCGIIALNCSETEVQVQFHEKGSWYLVKEINYLVRKIIVRDELVQNHMQSNQCDLLGNFAEQVHLKNFTRQVPPPVSFIIVGARPVFKCKHKPNFPSTVFNQFSKYSCKDYDLYYEKQGKNLSSLPEGLSDSCSVVHLTDPRLSGNELSEVNYNFISEWGPTFIIYWNVSQACGDCPADGGECSSTLNNGFKCGKTGANIGKKVAIGVISAIGVAILGVTIILYYKTRKSGKLMFYGETSTTIHFEHFIKQQGCFSPKRYSFKEIKRFTNSFKNKLGQGGYGGVFKGSLNDGTSVAVKLLSETKGNGEEFINEVASISRTSHVNIVSLLGYCFDGSKRALVYEFMPNGSLEKYIYNKDSSVEYSILGWEKLHNISVGIARGLEYLHRGCNTRILHFDIKPHNILLDQDFCPKIADFGLAKLCPRKDSNVSMLGARGTAGYIAPEVFCRNFGGISHKSDVYSYGMMLLEMVGGRKNIAIEVDHTSEIYFPHWIHKRIELNEDLGLHGIISEVRDDIPRKMILVGLWCIQTNPFDRPAMSRVLEMLEGSIEVLEIPPKPYLSSPSRVQGNSSISGISKCLVSYV